MKDDPARWREKVIKDYIAGPENSMQKWGGEPAWAEPIVGYSSGADPLYTFYKQDIGGFYLSPLEIVSQPTQARTSRPRTSQWLAGHCPRQMLPRETIGRRPISPANDGRGPGFSARRLTSSSGSMLWRSSRRRA